MCTKICGQQQLGKGWCVIAGVLSSENYFRIKYFRTFSVYNNIF